MPARATPTSASCSMSCTCGSAFAASLLSRDTLRVGGEGERARHSSGLRPDAIRSTPLGELAAGNEGLPERLHRLPTALHACDTATDDALVLAIRRKADHIAVVPCCQAEVAAQLRERKEPLPGAWPLLWAHPIHAREFGAHLTNVIRTLVLQSFGYQVTVTELVGWEHSMKNELILARKVHREHAPSKAEAERTAGGDGGASKLVRELC